MLRGTFSPHPALALLSLVFSIGGFALSGCSPQLDGEELVELVFQHYDQFDSRYKGLLPLRRVYVPVAIESDDE